MDCPSQKLLVHSAKLAAAQAKLCIKQLKTFFPPIGTMCPQIQESQEPTMTRRFNITRMANHFATSFVSCSTIRNCCTKAKAAQFNTPTLSNFYTKATLSQSCLPVIHEDNPSHTTAPQQRLTQRQKFNKDLVPNHPA
jgi:hypothetical protein